MGTTENIAKVLITAVMFMVIAGCSVAAGGSGKSVRLAGSTSMEKLADALAEGFMERYPEITVTVEFMGSSAGIASVLSEKADIGNVSRDLTEEEKEKGALEHVVAIDAIAIIVHGENTVTNLTTAQLRNIYTGEIKSWQEVGGTAEPVVVVGREAGSGTRSSFEEFLEAADSCLYANEMDSAGAVMARVASTPGAIGYVSLDILDDTVKAVSVDGIQPSEKNIHDGRYLFSRPLFMVTKGEIFLQSREVQAFFAYLESDEGRELIRSAGLVTPEGAEGRWE